MQRIHVADRGLYKWLDLLVEELYVFIRTVIYIGVYKEPQIPIYWNIDFNQGPLDLISSHLSLCCFEQIK